MRITESRLRRIIRSVISESYNLMDSDLGLIEDIKKIINNERKFINLFTAESGFSYDEQGGYLDGYGRVDRDKLYDHCVHCIRFPNIDCDFTPDEAQAILNLLR